MKVWSLLIPFLFGNLLCMEIICANIESLGELMMLDKHDLSKIKSRYPAYKKNPNLFNEDQFTIINYMDLKDFIRPLVLHEHIKLPDPEQLVSFAWEMEESGFPFDDLEKRIIHYLEQDELPFFALRKAIKRERFHRFKIKKNQEVHRGDHPFVQKISSLPLDEDDSAKIINAFAVCVDPYQNREERNYIAPTICEATGDYIAPRFLIKEVKVRQESAAKATPRSDAYHMLIVAAREIALREQLSIFEKVVMSKCIAEQSIRFIEPSQHPFSALIKVCTMEHKSPEDAFFMKTGVCGNFAGVAFNIANELGLRDRIHLAQNGWHIYLEFRDDSNFYHSHPFNRNSNCDITRY
jgi:hypothetical protein